MTEQDREPFAPSVHWPVSPSFCLCSPHSHAQLWVFRGPRNEVGLPYTALPLELSYSSLAQGSTVSTVLMPSCLFSSYPYQLHLFVFWGSPGCLAGGRGQASLELSLASPVLEIKGHTIIPDFSSIAKPVWIFFWIAPIKNMLSFEKGKVLCGCVLNCTTMSIKKNKPLIFLIIRLFFLKKKTQQGEL